MEGTGTTTIIHITTPGVVNQVNIDYLVSLAGGLSVAITTQRRVTEPSCLAVMINPQLSITCTVTNCTFRVGSIITSTLGVEFSRAGTTKHSIVVSNSFARPASTVTGVHN